MFMQQQQTPLSYNAKEGKPKVFISWELHTYSVYDRYMPQKYVTKVTANKSFTSRTILGLIPPW